MKLKISTILFIIFLLSLNQLAKSQQSASPYADWNTGLQISRSNYVLGLSPDEQQKMKELWSKIGEDFRTNQNPLAGTYLNGDYESGYLLRWSTAKGFILIPYFDQSLITDFSYGKVVVLNQEKLEFIPERDLSNERPFKKLPLKWLGTGKRLIPIEKLTDYGLMQAGLGIYNDFNGQCCDFTPSFTNHKIEGRDSIIPIPEKYKHFIKAPISGNITFVGRKRIVKHWSYNGHFYSHWLDKTALIPVKLNIGARNGVKRQMLLSVLDGFEFDNIQYLQITKVSLRTSEGFIVREFTYDGEEVYHDYTDDKDKPFPPVKIGTKVSTSK